MMLSRKRITQKLENKGIPVLRSRASGQVLVPPTFELEYVQERLDCNDIKLDNVTKERYTRQLLKRKTLIGVEMTKKKNDGQVVKTFQRPSVRKKDLRALFFSHNDTLALFPLLFDTQRNASRLAKRLIDAAILHGRALEVTRSAYSPCDLEALLVADCRWLLARLVGIGTLVGSRSTRAGCIVAVIVFCVFAEVAL